MKRIRSLKRAFASFFSVNDAAFPCEGMLAKQRLNSDAPNKTNGKDDASKKL